MSSDPIPTMLLDAAAEVGSLHRALLSGLRDLASPTPAIRAGGEQVVARLMAAGPMHFWLLVRGIEQRVLADAEQHLLLAAEEQALEQEPLEDASR